MFQSSQKGKSLTSNQENTTKVNLSSNQENNSNSKNQTKTNNSTRTLSRNQNEIVIRNEPTNSNQPGPSKVSSNTEKIVIKRKADEKFDWKHELEKLSKPDPLGIREIFEPLNEELYGKKYRK